MASPTFVSEATATDITTATSKACSFTTPTAGDLIVVGCYFKGGVGAISTPSGYTRLADDLAGAVGSGKSAVFWKTSDGTETSVTCQIATSTTSIAISVVVFGGGGAGNPIPATAADTEQANGASGTYDTPAGACDTTDDAHVIFMGFYYANDAGTHSVITGYTEKARAYDGAGSPFRLGAGFQYKLDGNATTITATSGTSAGTTSYTNAHVFGVTLVSLDSPPSNTVAPAVTGSTTVGSTLTTDDGTWDGSPAPTFTYQWKKNGVSVGGATADTFVIPAGAVAGDQFKCTVTATNTEGSASADSNSITVTVITDASGYQTALDTLGTGWVGVIQPARTMRGNAIDIPVYEAERPMVSTEAQPGCLKHVSARSAELAVSLAYDFDNA